MTPSLLSGPRRHRLLRNNQNPRLRALESSAEVTSCREGQEIPHSSAQTEPGRCVLAGAVRLYTVHSDGRRQIIDLLLRGDWFGLAAPRGYGFTAEAAVDDTILASYPRSCIESVIGANPAVAQTIHADLFETISRLQTHLLVAGRVTSPEKVGALLLELAGRLSAGSASSGMLLPFSRSDIADYLAISAETVSRSLSELRSRGAITLGGPRHITIIDAVALEQRSHAIRRPLVGFESDLIERRRI